MRDFGETDWQRLEEWARRIESSLYMSRYAPMAEESLLWCVIQANGTDVGAVWLERTADATEANLGILLGDSSVFGLGIGRRAINLAIEKARNMVPLQVVRLHVRDSNARAIACYEYCGFRVADSGLRTTGQTSYRYLSMEKRIAYEGPHQ